jgi:hypothetical protein
VQLLHFSEKLWENLGPINPNAEATGDWLLCLVSFFEPPMLLDLFQAIAEVRVRD